MSQNPADHTDYLAVQQPSFSPSILSCCPSNQRAFPSEKKQVMESITLSRQKQNHIVWTDLVFRIPPHRPQTKVPKKETRSHTPAAGTSNLQPCGSGCQLGKKNQQMKPLHPRMDSVRDKEAEKAKEPSLPPFNDMNTPSPSGNLAFQEKHKVKKILVDLRSILDNVIDPSEKELEERGLQNDAHSSSDLGDSSGKVLVPSKEAEEKVPTNDECPPSNARHPSSEEHETETTTTDSEDGQANQDILLPPSADPGNEFGLTSRTLKGIWSPPDETMLLCRNNLPAVQPSQPNLTTSTLSPKITLQQQSLPETDSTTHLIRTTPPSPDFQLPTQLLLQRLQETTTSKNHSLIMQVLRSLREELLAESSDSDDRDKWDCLPELPTGNPEKHWKPQTRTRKPVAPKRRLGKLTRCSTTIHAADSRQKAPNI